MGPLNCISIFFGLALLLSACQNKPTPWNGPQLTQPRDQLTVGQLQQDSIPALVDMSCYAKPDWADDAIHHFSGTITIPKTEFDHPEERDPYPGENIFPKLTWDFLGHDGALIPIQKERVRGYQIGSFWDVLVGGGRIWQETTDGAWSRASFPLTLTDSYIGQSRNCVATFVYNAEDISKICVQCSQETADLNDRQIGNIRIMLDAEYQTQRYADSVAVIEKHKQSELRRLPILPLSKIDRHQELADYFEQSWATNASTSLGAILMNAEIYLHPPKTRHGLYPYPHEMRHGLYSVTKSMAGALALFHLAEYYDEAICDALITDYVPALKNHPGWQGVTFLHTLNMVSGTVGSERAEHLLDVLITARTAEESIQNIAQLGDAPEAPGEKFNYASTNLFVLSYAMQNYVQIKEERNIGYWDLVHENVLLPIGAQDFSLLHTDDADGSKGIPFLAYGAAPTLDEAAKIAWLFSSEGNYEGMQLLHRGKLREALGRTEWLGHSLNNDFRGSHYRHSFWSQRIKTSACDVAATYMLGYGGNYVIFLPSEVVIFRFMDEYDFKIGKLVRRMERIKSSCPSVQK